MPDVTRRHVLAGLLGLVGAGAAGAYVQRSDGDGQAALGGATPEQDVGVIDYFVILDGEERSLAEADGPYNGIDLFGDCELVLEDGDAITLEDPPQ